MTADSAEGDEPTQGKLSGASLGSSVGSSNMAASPMSSKSPAKLPSHLDLAGATGESVEAVKAKIHVARSMSMASQSGHTQHMSMSMEEVIRVQSKISVTRPQTHRLPRRVMWSITICISVSMAVINNLIVAGDYWLPKWKFQMVQQSMDESVLKGALTYMGIAVAILMPCAVMVHFFAPACAGSGLPEMKGYLNGNIVMDLFGKRRLLVRIIGICLSVASGLPVGREGPMVSIGGAVGYGVVHLLASSHVKRWVKTSSEEAQELDVTSPALIVDTQRFSHAKRIGAALGGACGIAVAFNAPIGGILYMFEEATASSWPQELTLRAFVTSVLAALFSKAMLNIWGQDVHQLVIFGDEGRQEESWEWIDIPFLVILAIFMGLASALLTRLMLGVWTKRRDVMKNLGSRGFQPWAKWLDVALFVALCGCAWSLLPLLGDCEEGKYGYPETPGEYDDGHRRLAGQGSPWVRYTCPEGYHNEIASLSLAGAEDAIKRLYSRNIPHAFRVRSLVIVFCCWVVGVCGVPGLAVPMGLFVPSMVLGGLCGRMMGETLQYYGKGYETETTKFASAGVYALCGSAGFLSGFTHMTIAIVALLVEASHDLRLVGPLMVAIFVARHVSTMINAVGYDEVLILKKGVPYLDEELPEEMDSEGKTAGDVCDPLPDEALLSPECSLKRIEIALQHDDIMDFPVMVDGSCIGLTTRTRLEAAVKARAEFLISLGQLDAATAPTLPDLPESENAEEQVGEPAVCPHKLYSRRHMQTQAEHLHVTSVIVGIFNKRRASSCGDLPTANIGETKLSVHRIMDRAPFLILEDMPVARFYALFSHAGCQTACVITKTGEFCGLVTRESLIASTRDIHRPVQKLMRKISSDRVLRVGSKNSFQSTMSPGLEPSLGSDAAAAEDAAARLRQIEGKIVEAQRQEVAMQAQLRKLTAEVETRQALLSNGDEAVAAAEKVKRISSNCTEL
eukprot:TRINITY_DN21274_c0_g1_i2.p1 TRINITY_DN21274_c0_g1~~TRINITY_DN21274_c0_g1_i2.p1  ORF type:complete len:964 (-),score=161.63 TRINITY_DN21274_c0_g1_i2:265-3156(-)